MASSGLSNSISTRDRKYRSGSSIQKLLGHLPFCAPYSYVPGREELLDDCFLMGYTREWQKKLQLIEKDTKTAPGLREQLD